MVGVRLRGVDEALRKASAPEEGLFILIHDAREWEAKVQYVHLFLQRRGHVTGEAKLPSEATLLKVPTSPIII